MFTIPVDDFMQSLEHIGWFVKKRNTRKEMAFWNHVCYYFSFNSLEFPFWSCWFLISLPLPNPLCSSQLCCFLLSCTLFCLPIWWQTIHCCRRVCCCAAACSNSEKDSDWESENSHLLFDFRWSLAGSSQGLELCFEQSTAMQQTKANKPSSAVTKMARSYEEIPHHKKLLRFTHIHSREVIICPERDTGM